MIDAHGGNVLLHGLLHHPLEHPHRIVRVELNVLGDGIDGQRLVVVGGDKLQHLADIKLRMARDAILMGARGFVNQNRLPAGEAQPLQHQGDFIDRQLANLFIVVVQLLLPAAHLEGAQLLGGEGFNHHPVGHVVDQLPVQRPREKQMHRQVKDRHLLALPRAGQLMRRTGPEQGDIAFLNAHHFVIDQILHIAIERHVDLHLAVPVAGGHGVRRTQLDIHTLILRVERQRAAALLFIAAAHKRIGGQGGEAVFHR